MGNKKKSAPKAKEPIKIRFKQIANGNKSIYLDYYNNGKREYEYLRLYITPEKTPFDKEGNAHTLRLANAIKAQKIVELQNKAHGFTVSTAKQRANFLSYIQAICSEKKETAKDKTRGRHGVYNALSIHVKNYGGDQIMFKQVTPDFCRDFLEYLKTAENIRYPKGRSEVFTSGKISENTRYVYVKALNATLNRAVQEGIIQQNPLRLLPRQEQPKINQDNREFLTIDEVKQLVKTPCVKPMIKNAFLFSCFSGLRFCDVKALTWGKLQTDNDGKTIVRFTQQKTDKTEYLQLSDEALKFLPDRDGADLNAIIFPLKNNGQTNETLKSWILYAGITKRVTFHVGRHTNATLLLSLGVPIETVSKLLGHSDLKTTQIYAKVIDKSKREAVNKLDGLTD